jgi:IclR family acetate operon transcriptional repressor
VNLGLPDLLDLLVVDSLQGTRILHATAKAGWRSPYHSTALGKAFMVRWDAPMRQTIYRSCGLPELTPHTITEVDVLEAQLARFEAQGYAIDVEENEIGVNGIARWIQNGLGEVAAAISVSGHSSRLTEAVMEQIAPDVIAAADLISAAIGGGNSTDKSDSKARR